MISLRLRGALQLVIMTSSFWIKKQSPNTVFRRSSLGLSYPVPVILREIGLIVRMDCRLLIDSSSFSVVIFQRIFYEGSIQRYGNIFV